MLRVRQAIEGLNLPDLVRDGIVPDIWNGSVTAKKAPPCAYKNLSHFGIFMEEVFLTFLASEYEVEFREPAPYLTQETWKEVWNSAAKFFTDPVGEYDISENYFPPIQRWIKEEFGKYGSFIAGKEIGGQVAGHPDLVSSHAIFDVKTTGQFNAMRNGAVLQLLAYYALEKDLNPATEVTTIAIILPLQRTILTHDVIGWDHRPFLKLLYEAREGRMVTLGELFSLQRVGRHIHKGKGVLPSVKSWMETHPGVPTQIFLCAPMLINKHPVNLSEEELHNIAALKARFYIHAPYTINLAKGDPRGQKILLEELDYGVKMGAKGVVVHTGSNPDSEEGLSLMRLHIQEALGKATEACPLLLETPAGEGNDLLCSPEAMLEFFLSFEVSDRNRFKLCLDTCHVFAAGHPPTEYIRKWEGFKDLIPLIHWNDSELGLECHQDRHAPFGKGRMGRREMINALTLLPESDAVTE